VEDDQKSLGKQATHQAFLGGPRNDFQPLVAVERSSSIAAKKMANIGKARNRDGYAVAGCLTLPRESPSMVWTALGVLRMLASPPLAAAFLVAEILAPNRASRWALLAAAGIEGAVAGYAVSHWFAGCCFI
jgi:hypothetical protein